MPLLVRMEYKMELEVDMDSPDHDHNVGDIVAVKVENQGLWRVKVLEVGEEKVTLKYINEGSEGVHIVDDLHALPEDLATIPAFAQQCSLAGIKPLDLKWNNLAAALLAEITDGATCLLSLSDKTNPRVVNLYVEPGEGNSKDQKCCLSSYLVNKGLAKRKEEESLTVVNPSTLSKIFDIGVESEGEDAVADRCDDVIPVFNSTKEITKSAMTHSQIKW